MAILIGSRAWNDDFEDSTLGPDWDVVITKTEFVNLLKGEIILDISFDVLDDFKFRVKTDPKRVFEIELKEAYPSNKLLHNFVVASSACNVNFPMSPISPMACLALKTSHITFPINWRKNALLLAAMREWFKTDTLTELFGSNSQGEQLKQLVAVRSKETLARILAKTKSRVVNASNLKELKVQMMDESFAKFAPTDQSDAIYFRTTDTSVSKSKFNAGSADFKSEVVQKHLELIAGLYFLNHRGLAQLSLEDRCTEIYLLSLQTFCCQQVAEVSVTNHHRLAQRTYHIYQMYRTLPVTKDAEIQELVTKLTEVNVTELPLASDQQVAESTLGNPVIQDFVDNWSASTVTPSPAFREFMAKRAQHFPVCDNPVLPPEVVEQIFGLVDEHLTYCSLTALSKHYRAIYNSNGAWKQFTHKVWTEQQLSHASESGLINVPPSSKNRNQNDQAQWRQIFQELYDRASKSSFVLCRHCKSFHDMVPEHGRKDRDEAYWDHCPCEDCDASSWRSCPYADEYEWEDSNE